jgi:hypothetical protein
MPKIFDVLLGRTKPAQANLDALFGLVGAQITLQASQSLVPTGHAGVCYKPVAGRSFAETSSETSELLGLGDTGAAVATSDEPRPDVHQEDDKYGYHWVVLGLADFQALVNEVHLVNSTLQDNGFGPQLLCSVFAFTAESGGGSPTYLVYLYKRGTFYPFVPMPGGSERRDLEQEMLLQNILVEDLKIEPDKERWMALWGLPLR